MAIRGRAGEGFNLRQSAAKELVEKWGVQEKVEVPVFKASRGGRRNLTARCFVGHAVPAPDDGARAFFQD